MIKANTVEEPASALVRVTRTIFAISVVFFLLAGLLIVVGQGVHLVLGDATAARKFAKSMLTWSCGGASVAGLLSFALEYETKHTQAEDDD